MGRALSQESLVYFPEHRDSLLYLQPRFLRLLQPPVDNGEQLPAEALLLRAVDWTRPPVPTELISVLILHTGSVQQEQESSPRAKSLPVFKCPEAQELGLYSPKTGRSAGHQTPAAATASICMWSCVVDVGRIVRLLRKEVPPLKAECA